MPNPYRKIWHTDLPDQGIAGGRRVLEDEENKGGGYGGVGQQIALRRLSFLTAWNDILRKRHFDQWQKNNESLMDDRSNTPGFWFRSQE
jgi:hypothetical protein